MIPFPSAFHRRGAHIRNIFIALFNAKPYDSGFSDYLSLGSR